MIFEIFHFEMRQHSFCVLRVSLSIYPCHLTTRKPRKKENNNDNHSYIITIFTVKPIYFDIIYNILFEFGLARTPQQWEFACAHDILYYLFALFPMSKTVARRFRYGITYGAKRKAALEQLMNHS